jgi:hypothetical protein
VKDYRQHGIATLFGQATVRLRRFCCAVCGITEAGVDCPLRVRSTHALDQLRAQLSALIDISDGCRPAWADVRGGLDGNWASLLVAGQSIENLRTTRAMIAAVAALRKFAVLAC